MVTTGFSIKSIPNFTNRTMRQNNVCNVRCSNGHTNDLPPDQRNMYDDKSSNWRLLTIIWVQYGTFKTCAKLTENSKMSGIRFTVIENKSSGWLFPTCQNFQQSCKQQKRKERHAPSGCNCLCWITKVMLRGWLSPTCHNFNVRAGIQLTCDWFFPLFVNFLLKQLQLKWKWTCAQCWQ